jgi:N6-L-threonylcarbamoyladenine synthase
MFRPPQCLRRLVRPLSRQAQSKRTFTVLGIETSCDDTCVAVLDIDSPTSVPRIRHNVIRRSLHESEHRGGIVPMQAGLFHAKNLAKVLTEVRDAGGLEKLDLIAVTRGSSVLGMEN